MSDINIIAINDSGNESENIRRHFQRPSHLAVRSSVGAVNDRVPIVMVFSTSIPLQDTEIGSLIHSENGSMDQ